MPSHKSVLVLLFCLKKEEIETEGKHLRARFIFLSLKICTAAADQESVVTSSVWTNWLLKINEKNITLHRSSWSHYGLESHADIVAGESETFWNNPPKLLDLLDSRAATVTRRARSNAAQHAAVNICSEREGKISARSAITTTSEATHPAEDAHDGLRPPDELVEVETASRERNAEGARAVAPLHVHATFLPAFPFFASFLPSFLASFFPSFSMSVNSSSTCSTYRDPPAELHAAPPDFQLHQLTGRASATRGGV